MELHLRFLRGDWKSRADTATAESEIFMKESADRRSSMVKMATELSEDCPTSWKIEKRESSTGA